MRGAGLWIFGYGSLIWRPSFDYSESRPARVGGWMRRFWQGSTDHRGIPGAPGRVVTLLPKPGALCWGLAYRVAASDAEEVFADLDDRERGGYRRYEVKMRLGFPATLPGEAMPGTMYVATPRNPNYLGPAPLAEIARQVVRSRGPSGSNLEYVERLADSLRSMGAVDDHVFAVETATQREAMPG